MKKRKKSSSFSASGETEYWSQPDFPFFVWEWILPEATQSQLFVDCYSSNCYITIHIHIYSKSSNLRYIPILFSTTWKSIKDRFL